MHLIKNSEQERISMKNILLFLVSKDIIRFWKLKLHKQWTLQNIIKTEQWFGAKNYFYTDVMIVLLGFKKNGNFYMLFIKYYSPPLSVRFCLHCNRKKHFCRSEKKKTFPLLCLCHLIMQLAACCFIRDLID